jgi:hypothetical protein
MLDAKLQRREPPRRKKKPPGRAAAGMGLRRPLMRRRRVGFGSISEGERSAGPAVNTAASAPPPARRLLPSWHTRLARPGGGRCRAQAPPPWPFKQAACRFLFWGAGARGCASRHRPELYSQWLGMPGSLVPKSGKAVRRPNPDWRRRLQFEGRLFAVAVLMGASRDQAEAIDEFAVPMQVCRPASQSMAELDESV